MILLTLAASIRTRIQNEGASLFLFRASKASANPFKACSGSVRPSFLWENAVCSSVTSYKAN